MLTLGKRRLFVFLPQKFVVHSEFRYSNNNDGFPNDGQVSGSVPSLFPARSPSRQHHEANTVALTSRHTNRRLREAR